MSVYSVSLPFLGPPTVGVMSTVAFRVWILAASRLMRSISSCCVASCSGAVVLRPSTLRERNRQPVSGSSSSRQTTMR